MNKWNRLIAAIGLVTTIVAGGPVLAERTLLDAKSAQGRSESGELLLFDIRSSGEWRQTGVPRNAQTLTIHQEGGLEAFVKKMVAAVDGDLSRPIAVICAAGGRSRRAAAALHEHGFAAVYDVSEGMQGSREGPGWLERGLPLRAVE